MILKTVGLSALLITGAAFADSSSESALGATTDFTPKEMNGAIWQAPANVVFDNGPYYNSNGTGSGGANESILENTTLGMGTLGSGHQIANDNRVADDFTLDSTTTLSDVTFFAYQTGTPGTTSTLNDIRLRIWDGAPGAGGSNIVWGDLTTNVLQNTLWSGAYRVTETTSGDTSRPIMAITVDLGNLSLDAGTYWFDWQVGGTLASGPWAPPISITGVDTTGDALQSLAGDTYDPVLDSGTNTGMGFPFVIGGTAIIYNVPTLSTVGMLALGFGILLFSVIMRKRKAL